MESNKNLAEPIGKTDKPNSPVVENSADNAKASDAGDATCVWNGATYSEGSEICSSGTRLKCFNGSWSNWGNC
jgi:hypothetical protein